MWQKLSAALGSATPDPQKGMAAQESVPPPSVANKPAPGRTGPRGLSPRTTYTRVNTGAPPVPDAGTSGQKTQQPRGLEFLPAKVAHQENVSMTTAMKRPQLQDLIKEAYAGTVGRVDVTAEANRQLANLGQEPLTKQASVQPPGQDLVPTEYIEKLAGAMDFAATKLAEIGETKIKPGEGPNAMQVLEAPSGENPVQPGNQGSATPKNTPPANPPVQPSGVSTGDPANAMQTNDGMMHGEQPVEPIKNEKTAALYAANLASLGLVKEALSISPEGHKYDAAIASALRDANTQALLAQRAYGDEAPIKAQLLYGGMGEHAPRMAARHAAYQMKKHEAGQNPLNPFGGMLTPTSEEEAMRMKSAAATKEALAISPEGHQLDAAYARAIQDANERALLAGREYEDVAPIKGQLLGIGAGLSGFPQRLAARHAAYQAGKHEGQQNPLNPFGGMLTPTPAEEKLKRASMMKQALAISPEGHEYDAAMARAQQQAAETGLTAARKYEDQAPIKGQLLGIGAGLSGFPQRLAARHAAYRAGKHEKQQNPLNPFGGMLTPTSVEGAMKTGAVKQAFSISPEGHEYDAAMARARQQAAETGLTAARQYEDVAPIKGQLLGIGAGLSGFPQRLAARHAAYQAGKHEAGQNPLNPFGGMLTPTGAEEAMKKGAQADPLYVQNLVALGLYKQAEDALNPAKVAGGAAEATGADPPKDASPSEEQVPSEPSDVNSQKSMIGSNDAAINYKKVQAKKDPVSDMKDVVTEPGMSAAHDKTLNLVFDKTREAGAKIASDRTRTAAAQALLAKYAAGAKKGKEKQSQPAGMGNMTGGNPNLPTTPQAATGQSTQTPGM